MRPSALALFLAACGGAELLPSPTTSGQSPPTITMVPTEAPGAPPPPGTEVVGSFYEIRAEADVWLPTDAPLVLTLPVPPGTDTSRLGLAKIVDGAAFLDGGNTGERWLLLEGSYDAATQQFQATVASVSAAGDRYALVVHPDFAPRPAKAGELVLTSFDFYVECRGFDDSACTSAFTAPFSEILADVRGHLRRMGFSEPRLRVKTVPGNLNHGIGYIVYLAAPGSPFCLDDEGEPVGGIYHPPEGALYVCAYPDAAGGFPFEKRETAIHEYFHATQYYYLGTEARPEPFFIEGTATAAELSYTDDVGTGDLMARTEEYPYRRVDIPLAAHDNTPGFDDKLYEYGAQDFWVYVGRRYGRDLDYLIPILEAGGTRRAINRNLPDLDLGRLYWEWAKDQSFAHAIDIHGLQLAECYLLFKVVEPVPEGSDPGQVWLWTPVTDPHPFVGTLPPLTSAVVRVVAPDNFPEKFHIDEGLLQADLRYKVIVDGRPPCRDDLWGQRTLDRDAEELPSFQLYVLVSNSSLNEERHYRLDGIWVP